MMGRAFAVWMSAGALLVACQGNDGTMTPEALSERVGFALPEGTSVVHATPNAGREGLVRAKLELSSATVPRLLAATGIQKLIDGEADALGPDHGYWDPHRVARLRFGEARLPDSRWVVLGLDEARPDVTVVYLMVHGT